MRFLLLMLLFIMPFFASAQTAILRHNIVYLESEELFKLYSVGTFAHQTYKVKNLQDQDLILIDQTTLRNNQGTLLMKFIFMDMPQMEAYMPLNVNYKKQLARLLVNYNVIKNNTLNEQGVQLFCKNYHINNYPSKYISEEITGNTEVKKEVNKAEKQLVKKEIKKETKPVQEPVSVNEETADNNFEQSDEKEQVVLDENGNVKRDITQQIYLSGSKIRQDYKEIGSYTSEVKMLLGQEGRQITIFTLDGQKVAISRFINGDEQCELLTIRDNKTWNIPIPKGDMYVIVKDIVKVLSERMYL
jgi:hypothetical protein